MLWPGVFNVLNGTLEQSSKRTENRMGIIQTRFGKMLSFEWIGQMLASLCWIISVFSYGISTNGDWLQLLAASSWMVSNIASIIAIKN